MQKLNDMPPESIDQKLDEILTILKRMQQRQLTVRQVIEEDVPPLLVALLRQIMAKKRPASSRGMQVARDALNISITLTQLFRVRRSAKSLRVRDSGELQILG